MDRFSTDADVGNSDLSLFIYSLFFLEKDRATWPYKMTSGLRYHSHMRSAFFIHFGAHVFHVLGRSSSVSNSMVVWHFPSPNDTLTGPHRPC